MTKLLAGAFEKAAALPDELQDQLAAELIEELAWETQWDQTLANSQDQLDRLAQKAAEQYRAGKTKEKGFDEV